MGETETVIDAVFEFNSKGLAGAEFFKKVSAFQGISPFAKGC